MSNRRYSTVSLIQPASHNQLEPACYFFTPVLSPRRPLLAEIKPNGVAEPTELGQLFLDELERCRKVHPIHMDAAALMPDHAHVCFQVTDRLDRKVTEIATGWLIFSQRYAMQRYGEALLWNYRYRLFVPVNWEKYKRCIDYTNFNEALAAMSADESLFCTVRPIRHPKLDPQFSWEGYGDAALLDRPDIVALHVPHDATPTFIRQLRDEMMLAARADMTIAGGFISAAEKAIIKEVLSVYPDVRIIHFRPESLKYYKASPRQMRHFAARRWLELSSVPSCISCSIDYVICSRHNAAAEALACNGSRICFGEAPARLP